MLVESKMTHIFTQGLRMQATLAHPEGPVTHVRILPGMNEIDNDAWAAMLEHASVQTRIDKGDLIEKASVAMSKRPEREAIKLVKETFDAKLLQQWRADEERAKVADAIDAQMKECTLTDSEKAKLRNGEKL